MLTLGGENLNFLITGNMGYIGPSVVRRLKKLYPNSKIIGLDTGYFAHCLTNTDVLPESNVDIQYFADIRNFPENILDGIDAVVHLAAISNDPMGNVNEKLTFDVNYKASINLAKKAKAKGVKTFVFASSCSVYGFAEEGDKTEKSEVNPLTAYAKSKVFTERDLKDLADKNFKITSLRFSTACGMSERLRLDLVLNDFVASALATNKIIILSDGTPWRPLININDMAKAIDWALSRDINSGGEYLVINVGNNEWNYQIKDLANATAKIISNVEVSISKHAQPDKRSYKVNFDLYKTLAPKYQYEYDLIRTITELEKGLRAIGFNDKNFRASSFIRLKVLQNLKEKGLLSDDLIWKNKNQLGVEVG